MIRRHLSTTLLEQLDQPPAVVYPGRATFPLGNGVTAIGLESLAAELASASE